MGSTKQSPPRDGETSSCTIVRQVAAHEGVSPTELDIPLYDVVDPDALDAFLASSRARPEGTQVSVEFTYYGYEVEVRQDGQVQLTSVSDRDEHASASVTTE